MARLDEVLLPRLKTEASIQASEQFDYVNDLEVDIVDAISQHNQFYNSETLPELEVPLVMLLAWAKVCYRRASRFAQQPNDTGGQGFASDRTTPFNKNIKLAETLIQRYRFLVDSMGLSNTATGIVQGRLTKFDSLINQITPRSLGVPPVVTLAVSAGESLTDGTTLIIEWVSRAYNNFTSFILFSKIGATILQKWNWESATGVPGINDSAIKVVTLTDASQTSLMLTGLDKTQVNHLLLVNRSSSEKYSYSNELIFGGP